MLDHSEFLADHHQRFAAHSPQQIGGHITWFVLNTSSHRDNVFFFGLIKKPQTAFIMVGPSGAWGDGSSLLLTAIQYGKRTPPNLLLILLLSAISEKIPERPFTPIVT